MKPLPVLYEDDSVVVVNKPCGLATQGGSGIVNSVDTLLERRFGKKAFLVHRLDKDTAGILVAAKTGGAAREWALAFASGEIVKEYVALCVGRLPRGSGFLDTPAGKGGKKKDALTEYRVEETNGVLCRVRLRIKTGRTHQIRQQLSEAGCPVAADDKYGDFAQNRLLKKTREIKKLQLAAVKAVFPARLMPDLKERAVEIALPEHISAAWNSA